MAPIHGALLLLAILVMGEASIDPDDCPRPSVHQFYQELGCTDAKKGSSGACPTLYDCSLLNGRDHTKCYHHGKELTDLPQGELFPGACVTGCRCRPGADANSVGELNCAHIECPSLFNGIPEGCVETYSAQTCCSDGTLCQNNSTDVHKCEYGGETYLEGQHFYPKDKFCKKCTCMKGFDGTLKEPWCTTVDCGYEVHYASYIKQGCAPAFLSESSCCPIEWRCPEDSDYIEPAMAPYPEGEADGTCTWGKKVLKRGDKVRDHKISEYCVFCRCEIPPFVTCDRGPVPGPCPSD